MAVTQPAWKVGEKCPSCGGELVHFRPATKDEFAAYTNRESPRGLPARVDNAHPDQVAELGELYVCTACGYKTRVHPDAGGGDASGTQTADRAGTRSAAAAGTTQANADEVARLRAENERLRGQGGGQATTDRPNGPASGQAGAGANQQDEVARLKAENERLRTQGGGGQ